MNQNERNSVSIDVGQVHLSLPDLPGADAGLVASHIREKLAAMKLPPVAGARRMDQLALPPVRAMKGESAASLATRIVDALHKELTSSMQADLRKDGEVRP